MVLGNLDRAVIGHAAVKAMLCASVSALMPVAAYAQAVPSGAQPSAAETQTAEVAADDAVPGEIVVTAQRRAERLTDVPITVSVQSGAQLQAAGVTDSTGLVMVTPGLRMERLGVYTQPSIRGVTAASTAPGAEANVALYVDGIYQPNQAANNIDLPDVVRVEVLKGPQGTLFGRNATGGALQIFTRDPEYTPSGSFTLGYGRFNEFLAKGFVTAPLIDNRLAVSISGLYQDNDGWIHNLLNGGKREGKVQSRLIRAKMLYEPTEDLKFVVGGQYSHRIDNSLFLFAALDGNTSGKSLGGPIATEPYTTSVNFPSLLDVKSWNAFLKAYWAIEGVGTLSTLSAYQNSKIRVSADGDSSPSEIVSFATYQPDKNFTQELNFSSEKFGAVQIVAGLFYYRDNSGYAFGVGNTLGVPVEIPGDETVRAYAAYAEANVSVTDRLTAIAGVRYSYERRTVQYTGGISALIAGTDLHKKHWDAITPRFSLKYAVAPRTNVYATYSQGFKSGVYDLNSFATIPVNPEKIKSYEVGFKTSSRIFDFNVAAFLLNYSNLQVQFNNGLFDALQNAGSARNYGLDADATVRITPDFSLNGGLSLLHARYRRYNPASILVPITNGAGVPIGGNVVIPNADLSGQQVSRAPKWTLNLAATYQHEFEFGKLGGSANMYHTDDVPLEQSNRVRQKQYTLFNAQIWYELPASGLRFTLWGKNLSNKAVIQSSFITSATDGVSYAPPRTYGATVQYSF
ncbi:TonB-dependent receptor [Sphingomonas sp. SRS2]|uniref:TonB-dependent receptor n=1 Tax=Sphingomonas sp. SRS2 TaxID=133190 RepID=UPI0006184C3A|nr:TonB-dependent receptor [Sphingomonas sp. SRS2]KKC26023.1 hypothetical protein WP12_10380 [Sphingomonas sp. SRS2]